ncbi:MAG TPA: hypothetical protein VKR29_12915, partial [Candidatus Binataceae bacterium]|nr:hypothetical protein [Candidatus Binataceae bacterium]
MLIVVLVTGLSASAMFAAAAAKPQTKPKKVAGTVTGTLSAPVSGACTTGGTSYAATCPGTSPDCTCVTLSDGVATGGFGRGQVTGVFTLDNGDETPEDNCIPFIGSLALTSSRDSTTTTLDVNGALCKATVPTGEQIIGGGFDFDPSTSGFTGTGSIAGTVNTSNAVRMELVGATAPIPAASPSASA